MRLRNWASFVKLEHTLFSLPVLFGGAVIGARGVPAAEAILWIVVAGFGARSLALALNRIIDRRIDARNPRTVSRELPSGQMSGAEAWGIAVAGAAVYLIACSMLPPICLVLSPIPVVVFAVYPFMKRFTPLAHFGVGLALALAPLGGYVAVTGSLRGAGPASLLAGFTWLWVAGFDVIYATLDEDFDRESGLHSLPARLGRGPALRVAAVAHATGLLLLAWAVASIGPTPIAALFVLVVAGLLAVEHRLAHRVDLAFFKINLAVGVVVFLAVAAAAFAV